MFNTYQIQAIKDRATLALSSSDCQTALAYTSALYDSDDSDNDVRMLVSAAYGCYSGVNIFSALGKMMENASALSGAGFWGLLTGMYPSVKTDRIVEAAMFGMDAAMAELFPAEFSESAVGHVPNEWAIRPVGEVVDCVGGGTPSTAEPKYWEGGTHHWTTPKDFSSLQAPMLVDTDRKITDAGIAKISSGLLPAGTLLLSSRAPVGYLAIATMPVAINQGFIALKCNERATNYFMLNWCQSNMAEIESRATGTTFAEISKQNFRPIPVVLPPQKLMSAFTEKVVPLYSQTAANLSQSRTLAILRDTLLPKLLSGELKVPEHNY